MVKLTIGTSVEIPSYRKVYEIKVKFMHGDASSYDFQYARIPAEKIEYVEEILTALNRFENFPWNDARELYPEQPEFKKWFGGEYLGEYDDEPAYDDTWPKELTLDIWNELYEYSFEWPRDITYREVYARLREVETFYYDENGIKRTVKVEF